MIAGIRLYATMAGIVVLIGITIALIHHLERAGAAKVQAQLEQRYTRAVAAARQDERAAQTITDRVAADATAADDVSRDATAKTILEIHDALLPITPPADPVVPDSVRAASNAAVIRANRAADAADAAGGDRPS